MLYPIPRRKRVSRVRKAVPRRAINGVITYDDGREKCIEQTAEGNREYRRRTLEMRDRQDELCGTCGFWMSEDEATFDHQFGRTRGKRDDRIWVDGKRKNAAVHKLCNGEKGSRQIPYVAQ